MKRTDKAVKLWSEMTSKERQRARDWWPNEIDRRNASQYKYHFSGPRIEAASK